MEPREAALLHARARIAVGAAFVLFPGLAGRMWIGSDAARRSVKVLARAFGARDLAIGLLESRFGPGDTVLVDAADGELTFSKSSVVGEPVAAA